jgi:hypothetical protein
VAKREQLESTSEITKLTELQSEDGKKQKARKLGSARAEPNAASQPKLEPLPTTQSSHKANSKTQLRPPPERPSGHRKITRPEPKRLPRLNRGEPSPGPAP